MNIAFLNSIEAETFGGMEEWIRLVAEGLASKGHNITLIGRPSSEFLRRGGKDQKLTTFELNISGDFNPATIFRLKQFIRTNSINILVANFNKDVRLGGLAARFDGNAKVVWSLGLDITKNKLLHKFLTPKLIDMVLVPSKSLKKEIVRFGYIKNDIVEVIPIGIYDIKTPDKTLSRDKLLKKYKLPDNSIISVTSGRFVEQKGHEFLIRAASEITRTTPEIRFLFLGNGPLLEMLKNLIQQLNLQKFFLFTGMLDDINETLFGADLMIHPSRKEPFGIAVLEGMRAKLPMAASRVGGIPEVVKEGENALLFEVGNISGISHTVTTLLNDTDLMNSMGIAGRNRFLKKFKQETMIEQIERSFIELSAGKSIKELLI